MTFNVFVQSTNIGTLSLNDVYLVPGNNTMPFTANIDLSKFLAGLNVASGTIDVVFSGNSTIYNGEHVLYYVCTNRPDTTYMNTNELLTGRSFSECDDQEFY